MAKNKKFFCTDWFKHCKDILNSHLKKLSFYLFFGVNNYLPIVNFSVLEHYGEKKSKNIPPKKYRLIKLIKIVLNY